MGGSLQEHVENNVGHILCAPTLFAAPILITVIGVQHGIQLTSPNLRFQALVTVFQESLTFQRKIKFSVFYGYL